MKTGPRKKKLQILVKDLDTVSSGFSVLEPYYLLPVDVPLHGIIHFRLSTYNKVVRFELKPNQITFSCNCIYSSRHPTRDISISVFVTSSQTSWKMLWPSRNATSQRWASLGGFWVPWCFKERKIVFQVCNANSPDVLTPRKWQEFEDSRPQRAKAQPPPT